MTAVDFVVRKKARDAQIRQNAVALAAAFEKHLEKLTKAPVEAKVQSKTKSKDNSSSRSDLAVKATPASIEDATAAIKVESAPAAEKVESAPAAKEAELAPTAKKHKRSVKKKAPKQEAVEEKAAPVQEPEVVPISPSAEALGQNPSSKKMRAVKTKAKINKEVNNGEAELACAVSNNEKKKGVESVNETKEVIASDASPEVAKRNILVPAFKSFLDRMNKKGLCVWFLNDAEREAAQTLLPKGNEWRQEKNSLKKLKLLASGGFICCENAAVIPDKSAPGCNGILIPLAKQKLLEEMGAPGVFRFFE